METIRLDSIKPNPGNPRVIRDDQFRRLVESIKRDPEFLRVRGIVHAAGVILGGNQRYRAIQEAMKDDAFRETIGVELGSVPTEWVQDASGWDEEKARRFVLIDNAPSGIAGEWDWNMLANEWDAMELELSGIVFPQLEIPDPQGPKDPAIKEMQCPSCGHKFEAL